MAHGDLSNMDLLNLQPQRPSETLCLILTVCRGETKPREAEGLAQGECADFQHRDLSPTVPVSFWKAAHLAQPSPAGLLLGLFVPSVGINERLIARIASAVVRGSRS